MNNQVARHLVWTPILLMRGQNIWPLMRRFHETQYRSRDEIEEEQLLAFRRVLLRAFDTIPFYRAKYRAAGMSRGDLALIEEPGQVPVLTKQEVMAHFEQPPAWGGKRFRRSTSGSSGKPLLFYKDSESMAYIDAILYRNYSWYGIELGDRQARFWGHPLGRRGMLKTHALDALLNRIRLSPFDLQEESYLRYLRQIQAFRPAYIYGYAQTVFQFARYFHERGIELSSLRLKAVILTGEMVFPRQIATIREVFASPVTQEYGCTEVGLIGFGCPEGNIHLMENLLVQTVKAGRTDGTGDVVVSELYGQLFPFIGYQLGDRGIISASHCACGRGLRVLERLAGRKDDFIVCPDGRLIDPYLVEYAIGEMPRAFGTIDQFKIVQDSRDKLRVMLMGGAGEVATGYLKERLARLLPQSMRIEVEVVRELPKEFSGKLRCFTSLLHEERSDHAG